MLAKPPKVNLKKPSKQTDKNLLKDKNKNFAN